MNRSISVSINICRIVLDSRCRIQKSSLHSNILLITKAFKKKKIKKINRVYSMSSLSNTPSLISQGTRTKKKSNWNMKPTKTNSLKTIVSSSPKTSILKKITLKIPKSDRIFVRMKIKRTNHNLSIRKINMPM